MFNDPFKGDERPPGKLGRAYEITYFLPNSDGELVVTAEETVYPFAEPPVAFAAKGQRQDFGCDRRSRLQDRVGLAAFPSPCCAGDLRRSL